jgi:hypothetical protein
MDNTTSRKNRIESTIVGFYEDVIIEGKLVRAKVDTGASKSSIDLKLAELLKLGPVIGRTTIVNTHGRAVRPIVRAGIEMAGRKLDASFNIALREHLRYPILIGKNILRRGFVIDPKKKLKKQNGEIIKNTQDLHESA